MFKLMNKKRAQSTAEYAIVLALVVGAVVAMQVYVKRGINSRIKDTVDYNGGLTAQKVGDEDFTLNAAQYEPYYLDQNTTSASGSKSNEILGQKGEVGRLQSRISKMNRVAVVGWSEKDAAGKPDDSIKKETVEKEIPDYYEGGNPVK